MIHFLTYLFLPIAGSIFICYALMYAMGQMERNRVIPSWKCHLCQAGYILAVMLFGMLGNSFVNLLLLLVVPVIGHFIYNDTKLHFAYYVGLSIILFLSDAVISLVFQLLYANGILYFFRTETYLIIQVITTRLLEWMIIKIVAAVICKRDNKTITVKQMIAAVLLPLASIFLLYSLLIMFEVLPNMQNMVFLVVDIVLILLINIYITFMLDTMSRNNQLQNELMLYRQQEHYQKEYYDNLEQKYQSTRKLVHDIRNHIQLMEHLYAEQENTKGLEYAKDIHDILNQLGQKYYTSNKILNMILNDKADQMSAKGIECEIKIADCSFDFIRDMDLTTIFGNLLDNAMAAAEDSKEKKVSLIISKIHDFVSITLENTAAKAPVIKDGRLISHKVGHEALGIRNVERVVKKYKGEISYEWNSEKFVTRLMFTV